MTSDFKDDSLKLKDAEWLEQYLAGKAPLHAEDLHLPSAEELNAAEAAFDEIVAGRQKTARRVPLWAWAAAVAAVLMVAVLLWPQSDAQETPALMATRETPKQQGNEKEAQPVTVEQASQEHLLAVNKKENVVSQKSETESLEQKIAGLTIVPTSADLGPGVTMRLGGSADTLAHKGVDEPLEQKIVSLTIVPTSADLGPGVTMRFGGSADTLAHKGVDEPLEQKIASLTIVPTSADLGPGVTMRFGKPADTLALKGVDEPLEQKIVSLTIVPTSADLGPGVKMRFGKPADTLALKGVDEPLEQKIASLTIVPTSADLGPGVTMRFGKPAEHHDTDPVTAVVLDLQQGKNITADDLLCNDNILLIFAQLKKQYLAGQNTEFNAISIYNLCKRAHEYGFFSGKNSEEELKQLKQEIASLIDKTPKTDEGTNVDQRIYLGLALSQLEKIE